MSLCVDDIRKAECLGDWMLGGYISTGRINNLRYADKGLGVVEVFYGIESDNATEAVVVTGCDGEAITISEAVDGSVDVGNLASGSHSIEFDLRNKRWISDPYVEDEVFDFARLTWTASSSSDVVSYKVYHSTNGADYTLIKTITEIIAASVKFAKPGSGTGTGRVSISGNFTGAACNADWNIKVSSAGNFKVDPGTGVYGTAKAFTQGMLYTIGSGLYVSFHSPLADYATNDIWTFRIGPKCSYNVSMSPYTAADYYKITAVDAAGNESAATTAVQLEADNRPNAPYGLAVTYATGTFTITWTDPDFVEDAYLYRLYANYSSDIGDLDDEVIFDNPVASFDIMGGSDLTGTYTPATTPSGTWKFALRCYTKSISRDSANTDHIEVTMPYSAVTVPAPFNVTATAAAGGTVTVKWYWDNRDGTATHFKIYQHDTSTPSFGSPLTTEASTITSLSTGSQTYTTAALGAQKWFTVRAVVSSTEGANVDVVTATPDSTAPNAPTGFVGNPT